MTTKIVVCSKVNYTNLSRYSDLSERTYRRHFERGIGFEGLNQALIEPLRRDETVQIAVVDCTFVEKSGRHTYGLDQFYSGKTRRPERGLELSAVAIVDLEQKSGYKLSAQQTEAGLQQSGEASEQADGAKGNRIDFYLGHLAYCTTSFPTWIRYLVADGFYSKYKWVTGVVQLGFHAIGKLRCDANLKFLGGYLYTAVVWSVSLKRKIRLAYLLKEHRGRRSYVGLFSTDLDTDPFLLYRCYTARFQIEFIFRDARQFTGLVDCQARSPEAIDTHVNASLMALNLAKVALQDTPRDDDSLSFSLASFRRLALNQHLLDLTLLTCLS
jgi:hypothetical protein